MKKLLLINVLILLTGSVFAQSLQKGNLVGTHVMTVTLEPGATMDQFIEYFNNKVIPVIEKSDPSWKAYLAKSVRGEIQNGLGIIYVVKSEKDRDKYYNPDGSSTDLGVSFNKKLEPVLAELNKLGTFTTSYTDWIIF